MKRGWFKPCYLQLVAIMAGLVGLPLTQAAALTPVPAPPVFAATDGNGVDQARKTYVVSRTDLTIGPSAPQGMSFGRFWMGSGGWRDTLAVTLSGTTAAPVVSYGGNSYTFQLNNGVYQSLQYSSYTLTTSGNDYIFTMRGGTVVTFAAAVGGYDRFVSNLGWAKSIVYPNGTRWDFHYRSQTYCPQPLSGGSCGVANATSVRLQSATSNFGYQLKLEYAANALTDINGLDAWNNLTKVTAINNAVESCTPTADSCTLTQSWPSVSYASSTSGGVTTETVTNALGGITRYTMQNGRITGIKRPGSSTDNVTIGYDASGYVQSITADGIPMAYSWSTSFNDYIMTVTGPLSTQRSSRAEANTGKLRLTTDALSRNTNYTMTKTGEIIVIDDPKNGKPLATLDARGNITEQGVADSLGTTSKTIFTYPDTCANPKTCDKPKSSTNPYGINANYTYDSTHGGLTLYRGYATSSVTPGTRTAYTSIASGFTGGGTIYLPNVTGSCRTLSSGSSYGCTDMADEVKTTTVYGASSANYLPITVSTGAGDGSLVATNAMTYDAVGNVLTVDGPMAGAADMVRAHYDALRRVVGTVSPDPDGAGPLKMRATRTGYNADGQVTLVEQGTVNGPSDSDWAAMIVLQATATTYDGNGRKVRSEFISGGVTQAVTQYSYDAAGRLDCTAVRMNPAVFGSLPASACILGTQGSDGPDRITHQVYDTTGAVLKVQQAYGTPLQQDYVTYKYLANSGSLDELIDANANTTRYQYDSFNSLIKTTYPSPSTGQPFGATEERAYDAARNRVSTKKRTGDLVYYRRNERGQIERIEIPHGADLDIYMYTYDLIGLKTKDQSSIGNAFSAVNAYSYDALGRLTSDYAIHDYGVPSYNWTKTMQYDLAGRRTRLTWADGFYVTYEYDVLGELTAIKENGSTPLVSFSYDDLGRRTSMVRGNGTSVSYSYDGASRLSQIVDDLAGATADQTVTFSYTPASQIKQLTRSNDAYAWTQHYNVSRNYTVDRLNRYTAAGSIMPTYDQGRLKSAGSTIYSYDSVDHLTGATGGHVFHYDGAERLAASISANEQYDYDGPKLIAEYSTTGTLLRRYVHEFGDDKPLVWYEGSGTTDKRWLSTDERGSVTAITNSAGVVININSYDPWGIPQSANLGRFQYTGQTWMPELGMYYYKARIYSPTLGRFLQTDPIGYDDGPNWYAYAHNDPVNGTDPNGRDVNTSIAIGAFEEANRLAADEILVTARRQLLQITWSGQAFLDRLQSSFATSLANIGNWVPAMGGASLGNPPSDLTENAPGKTQTPTSCQQAFLKDQLESRGLPTTQIDQLKFVSGLDGNANSLTRLAFPNAVAVTQGTTVYVQPSRFNEVANFRSPVGFEEAYHTAQFALYGPGTFYDSYGVMSAGAALLGLGSRDGNLIEQFAEGASREMYSNYQDSGCPK